MAISFGKIIYVNNTMNSLAPSIPKFKLVLYTDIHMDKTFIILYTQNNKYVHTATLDFFAKTLNSIKEVLNLPFDNNTDIYYGDELLIELKSDDSKNIIWKNIREVNSEYRMCNGHQPFVTGTLDECNKHNNKCIVYPLPPVQKLTARSQKIYDNVTEKLFAIMLDIFRDKIPETFYKKY